MADLIRLLRLLLSKCLLIAWNDAPPSTGATCAQDAYAGHDPLKMREWILSGMSEKKNQP